MIEEIVGTWPPLVGGLVSLPFFPLECPWGSVGIVGKQLQTFFLNFCLSCLKSENKCPIHYFLLWIWVSSRTRPGVGRGRLMLQSLGGRPMRLACHYSTAIPIDGGRLSG